MALLEKDANINVDIFLAYYLYIQDDDEKTLFNRILVDIQLGLEKHMERYKRYIEEKQQEEEAYIEMVNSQRLIVRIKRNPKTVVSLLLLMASIVGAGFLLSQIKNGKSNFIHIGYIYIRVLFEDELETSTLSTTTLQELKTPVLILSTPCYAHLGLNNNICTGPPTPPLIIDKFGQVNANFTFDFDVYNVYMWYRVINLYWPMCSFHRLIHNWP